MGQHFKSCNILIYNITLAIKWPKIDLLVLIEDTCTLYMQAFIIHCNSEEIKGQTLLHIVPDESKLEQVEEGKLGKL